MILKKYEIPFLVIENEADAAADKVNLVAISGAAQEQRQEQLVRLVQKLGRLEMLHRVRLEYPVRVERRQEQLVRLA